MKVLVLAMTSGNIKMMVRYLSDDETVGFRLYYPEMENSSENKFKDFSCKFETFGLAKNISGSAMGVDAVQSLTNAIMRLDIFLKSSAECEAGKIRWVGARVAGDFGLPWDNSGDK
jgi:hypothetical protein